MSSRILLKYFPKNLLEKLVAVVILLKLLSFFLPFEFSNNGFRESFKFYHNVILLVLLFVFSLVEILSDKSGFKIWVRVLLFIPLTTVFLITGIVVLFVGYCEYEEAGTLYVQKNGDATIVSRSLNCGATTDYSYKTYYIKPLNPFFNFKWGGDDTNIDKTKWIKPTG